VPQPDLDGTGNESEDEIDAALTDLQMTLEGSAVSATGDITRTPELHGYIRFLKYVTFLLLVCAVSLCIGLCFKTEVEICNIIFCVFQKEFTTCVVWTIAGKDTFCHCTIHL